MIGFLIKYRVLLFVLLALAFAGLIIYALANEQYEVSLLAPAFVMLLITSLAFDKIFFLITFSVPLSINLLFKGIGAGLSFPSEPLMAFMLVVFFLKLFSERQFDRKVLNHPITLLIFAYLIWVAFTIVPSTLPMMSVKYLITRVWFIVVFYFIGTQLFKKLSNISWFYWTYTVALMLAVFFIWAKHAQFGFSQKDSYLISKPFFVDHTVYGGAISFFVFFPFLWIFSRSFHKNNNLIRFAALMAGLVILTALLFSYSRAAWLGVMAAVAFIFILKMKVRFRTLMLVVCAGLLFIAVKGEDIFLDMKKTDKHAMGEVNAIQHAQSISNVSSDVSNIERLNRWESGFKMFAERPVVGWGPGTYMFKYSPFQKGEDMTEISSTEGHAGGIHSEYFAHMVEMGIPGLMLYLLLLVFALRTAMRLCYTASDKRVRLWAMCTILALITYAVHGLVNNFLDQDKVAVPFWACMAILVSLDVYHKGENKNSLTQSEAV